MTEQISIQKITDPAHLDQMTDWMYGWWGRTEGFSREAVRAYMAHSLQETRLPQTWGLFLGDRLIGMYQFTNSDLFPRPDLYPWLANVYIDEPFRGVGLGRRLLASVHDRAAEAGLTELYLFTTHQGLYERFGWVFLEETDAFLEPRIQRIYRLGIQLQERDRLKAQSKPLADSHQM